MQKQITTKVLLLLLAGSTCFASKSGLKLSYGVLTITGSTGNKSVTGLDFTPKAGLFIINSQASQNAAGTSSGIGWGVSISTSKRVTNFVRRVNASTTYFGRHSEGATLVTLDTTGAINFEADFVSWNSDGFTLNVSTSPAVSFYAQWWVWDGIEVQGNLVQFDSRTSPGSQPYTGMGFKSDVLIVLSMGMTATIPTTDGNSRPGFGFATHDADGTIRQAGLGNKHVSGANSARRAQSTSSLIYIPDTSAMWLEGALTSFDADGFTVNYSTVQASAVKLWALGLTGLRGYVSSFNQNTSTGSQPITAVGRQPQAIIMASFCRATATAQQTDGTVSIGGASGSNQGNNAFTCTSGSNNNGHANYNNQILTCLTGGTPTVNSQASFTSFDSTGFTINNGTADATSREVIYLTMSPLPLSRFLITRGPTLRNMLWQLPQYTD
jgi:hypothetical protein